MLPIFDPSQIDLRIGTLLFRQTKTFTGNPKAAPSQASGYNQALLAMIEKSQAVIMFNLDGEILQANDNFLSVIGYTLDEIKGRHHSMFVAQDYAQSSEYSAFWDDLRAGEDKTSQFVRYGKSGAPIFIYATYCPVLDADGNVQSIIKLARNVTDRQEDIDHLSDALDGLSDGVLSHKVRPFNLSYMAPLGTAFNRSIERLAKMVTSVKQVAGDVQESAQYIHDKSLDLAKRSETQAATLEETAAAVEELTSNANTAAENAQTVNVLATDTRESTRKGQEQVNDLTGAMEKIKTSSEQIAQIVSVIEGIAFQTNLLALNAGVEAAARANPVADLRLSHQKCAVWRNAVRNLH